MINHIVLFKLHDGLTAAARESMLESLKEQFEALAGVVPSLRSIEVGLNVNPDEKYHLALEATFDDLEGLRAYASDARHLAVSCQMREYLELRACVDYEI